MRAVDIIQAAGGEIIPAIHLASWNDEENPLDSYLANRFGEWQRCQLIPFLLSLRSR
jgi:hypothetical protein